MTAFDHTFRAAIPGSSLAHHKLGDLPHEKPPKYTKPNEALDYFWQQFHRPEILKQLWLIMENGGTVYAITKAILYKAAMEGVIQMNLGMVIAPTVSKMIATIGQSKGIKVIANPKFRDRTTDQMMNKKLNEKLGHKGSSPIPQSALKSMILPKANEITKDAKLFETMNAEQEKQQAQPQVQATPTTTVGKPKGLLAGKLGE